MSTLRESGRSYRSLAFLGVTAAAMLTAPLGAQHLLLPMDDAQQNHLKAYGITFNALKAGFKAE